MRIICNGLLQPPIVVAIIAVLVAIAIPVFNSQLEKSRDAVSVANMRTGYAEVMTCVLNGAEGQTDVTFTSSNNSKVAGTYAVKVNIKSQSVNDWSGLAAELPWVTDTIAAPTDPGTSREKTLTFTVDANGAITGAALS